MKKALSLFVLLSSFVFINSGVALADQKNTGCGLGTLVLGSVGNQDSVLMQILIVTTNGTSGSQTFGITSGTSNCAKPAAFVSNDRLENFVADNMDNLAADIAAGKGETLETVAELMAVPSDKKDIFFSSLQKNFSTIYSSSNVQSADVIDSIVSITAGS